MLSNKIYKHFFFELSKYFFIVLFALSTIVWAVQSVNLLDLIVEDGHAIGLYLQYSLLNIPKILTRFIPLSFLIALIITIRKLEGDNELITLWTSGLNKINVINFFFKIALVVTLLQLFLASLVNPSVLNYSRSLIKGSDVSFVSGTIKTNQFNDTIKGLTIFVEEKDQGGNFKNIFIRDESRIFKSLDSSEDTKNLTIFAKKARILQDDKNFLVLEDGTIHSEKDGKKVDVIGFKKTKLNLDGMKTKSITRAKVQETNSKTLINCLVDNSNTSQLLNCPKQEKFEVLAELNRRFGMPLYIPFISLICSFLLITREENKFNTLYKYFYGFLSFVTLIIAEILVRYSGLSKFYAIVYYVVPLIFVPLLYIEIIRTFLYENLKKKL
tara:strand:+ start:1456 stop:2607 length:1152 start_codon:yes stop_codon:yes gene_type:complete